MRHPSELGAEHMSAFVSSLATERHVSASTQNQALSAVLFLYRDVLWIPIGHVDGIVRARVPARLPVVLTRTEVSSVLSHLDGQAWLGRVVVRAGLRLQEALELRVKDIDFDRRQITVRQGKGRKDRMAVFPSASVAAGGPSRAGRRQHARDLESGFGRVPLPGALDVKFPNAGAEWAWQFVFPASRVCRDPRWGPPCRYHVHESAIQRAVAEAVRRAGIAKRASCHTRSGIRSRRTCWRMAMTSARYRNCSGTRM